MIRLHLSLLSTALAVALSGFCGVGISHASPSDGSGRCTFGITPPTVVPVSGVTYVYASLRPGTCTLDADPYASTVCLSIEGDDSAGQCASKPGVEPAELYVAYRRGATYVEKGRGCAGLTVPPYTVCEDFPASRFTP
jgi:hypothetical protein